MIVDLARPSAALAHFGTTTPAPKLRSTSVGLDEAYTDAVAAVLRQASRKPRLASDFDAEVDGVTHVLQPLGIKRPSVRLALSLMATPGGRMKGTAHVPNARLGGQVSTEEVRSVRDAEITYRSAYLVNASRRIQRGFNQNEPIADVMANEKRFYLMHEKARRGRLLAAAQSAKAAQMFGGLVGWYLNPLLNNEAECIVANGHNFYASVGTIIGYPGAVHPNCGCTAGPPHEGAGLVDDALRSVHILRPKIHLKRAA